jgi:hypothetical protein
MLLPLYYYTAWGMRAAGLGTCILLILERGLTMLCRRCCAVSDGSLASCLNKKQLDKARYNKRLAVSSVVPNTLDIIS